MTVSAESDDPDWKLAPTGLTATARDEVGELDVTWDPNVQDTKTLSDYRVTWTPDGEDFKDSRETDWSAYPTTNQLTVTGLDAGATYQVKVRARYDDNKTSIWSDAVRTQFAGVDPVGDEQVLFLIGHGATPYRLPTRFYFRAGWVPTTSIM